MNQTTLHLFDEYLAITDDKSAAASLTLADVMQSALDGKVQPTGDRPLTVPEVAKHLRVSSNKVLAWIRSERLRGYNVAEKENGRPKYRVDPADLEAFILQRTVARPAPRGRPAGRRLPQPKWQG